MKAIVKWEDLHSVVERKLSMKKLEKEMPYLKELLKIKPLFSKLHLEINDSSLIVDIEIQK